MEEKGNPPALKMQQSGTMEHALRIRLVLGCLLAVLWSVPVDAAAAYRSAAPSAQLASGAAPAEALSFSATDHEWHGPEAKPATQVQAEPGFEKSILTLAADGDGDQGDATDVVRHRGFRKALLIILVCGALIRLLTSPSYKKFISDVLDPKAF